MTRIHFALLFKAIFQFLLVFINASPASGCKPYEIDFSNPGEVSYYSSPGARSSPFVVVSPQRSYSIDSEGLKLYLYKPEGRVKTTESRSKEGWVNDKTGEGATVNSTFNVVKNSRVTFTIRAPEIAGVVTAAILIGVSSEDEIDIEILGKYPDKFQTNLFAPSQEDRDPHYGHFGGESDVDDIGRFHQYSVSWDPREITWAVDGTEVRTVQREDTRIPKNPSGVLHYPSHDLRVQLGIWDASSPVGTSNWAGGPIQWESRNVPARIEATIKRLTVECY